LGIGFHECGHKEENMIGCISSLYTVFSSINIAYPFFFLDIALSMSVSQSVMDEI
jgi:hypothetical protein